MGIQQTTYYTIHYELQIWKALLGSIYRLLWVCIRNWSRLERGALEALHACSVTSVMYDSFQSSGLYPSMGFAMQEYWKGLHALLQGIVPTQGSSWPRELCFLHWQGGSLPLVPPGKPSDGLLENKILKVLKGEWKLIGRIRGGVPYKENRIYIKAWR